MKTICVIDWTEYERGWGSRPDGISLHPSKTAADEYRANYHQKYNSEKVVPDCYSTLGEPYPEDVSDEVFDFISKNGHYCTFRNNFKTACDDIVEEIAKR